MNNLDENLKKTFYSSRESKLEIGRNKHLSTTTPAILSQETDMVMSDVSHSYVMGSQTDYILTKRNALLDQWRSSPYQTEVDEAIQEIVNDALVFEENESYPFELNMDEIDIVQSLKDKIEEAFMKIMGLLDFSVKGEELFRQWYVDGVISFEIVYDNTKIKDGIKKIILLSPYNFFKMKDIETGEIVFFYNNRLDNHNRSSTGMSLTQLMNITSEELKYKPEQITQIVSGIPSEDRLFSISNLNKAMKILNQVSLIEDAILIHRITRAPDKKIFYIDTGRMSKGKAEQYMKTIMSRYRNRMTYNVSSGQVENRKERVAMQEDYWIPRTADGKGTQIEQLPGSGAELGEIADLEYFFDKLYRSLNVPVNRRDNKDSRIQGLSPNNLELEREELKFNRFILQLRKRFVLGIKDILKKELLSTNTVSLKDWIRIKDKLVFKFRNNNEWAEMKKLQIYDSRMNIASMALQLQESGVVSKMFIRKDIMGQTDEEIAEMDKEIDGDKDDLEDDMERGLMPGGLSPPEEALPPEEPVEEPAEEPVPKEDEE